MLETITSTASSVSSFGNITSALATTAALVFDNNTTDVWNASDSANDNVANVNFSSCDPSNPEFNCSVDDFLRDHLGARQMPLETAIWVSRFHYLVSENF